MCPVIYCFVTYQKTVWQQWTHSTCGPRFVDCDDLNDLTRLFSYVGQDTETLVVLASPDILTRKWCVGEICTARISRPSCVSYAVSFLWRLSDSEKTKNKQRVLHHKRELKHCSLLENFGASKEDSEIMTGVAHMTNVYHRFMTFMTQPSVRWYAASRCGKMVWYGISKAPETITSSIIEHPLNILARVNTVVLALPGYVFWHEKPDLATRNLQCMLVNFGWWSGYG